MSCLHHTPSQPPPILHCSWRNSTHRFGQRCPRYGEGGQVKVRPGRQRRGSKAGLELAPCGCASGGRCRRVPMRTFSETTGPKGPCGSACPWPGGHPSTLTVPHCPSPAKAGGPERRPASPTSPPALLPPQAGQRGGRPCLLPGEPAARPDGADGGREAAKLSVWRCPSEPLLAGARRVGRRWSWAVRAFTEMRPERRCLTARPPN